MNCILVYHSCKRKLRRIIRKVKNPEFVPNTRLSRKIASLLIWHQIIDPKYMRPPPQLIDIKFASSDDNSLVDCVMYEKEMKCCCDRGAHKCIMSFETFQCLNIDQNSSIRGSSIILKLPLEPILTQSSAR